MLTSSKTFSPFFLSNELRMRGDRHDDDAVLPSAGVYSKGLTFNMWVTLGLFIYFVHFLNTIFNIMEFSFGNETLKCMSIKLI